MRRSRQKRAELGKWDSSYPDASPKRPVKVNYPWFNDHNGNPYFAEPDPRIFNPAKVTAALQRHAKDIWSEYQRMRMTKLPSEYGLGHTGLPFEKFAVIYQKQADLSTPEMDNLYRYLMAIRWVTSSSYKSWRDLLKRNELNQVRTPKWFTNEKSEAPEVTLATSRRRRRALRRDLTCSECGRPMDPWEAGDVLPEELVCDECAGYEPTPEEQEVMELERKQCPHRKGSSKKTAFPGVRRLRLSEKLQKQGPLERVETLLEYVKKLQAKGASDADLGEIKETLDYHIDLVSKDHSEEVADLLKKYDYTPKQKKESERTSRYRRRTAIPRSKLSDDEVWSVFIAFNAFDYYFEEALEEAIWKKFKNKVESMGSGTNFATGDRDLNWDVVDYAVDDFVAFVKDFSAKAGVKVTDVSIQTLGDVEREWNRMYPPKEASVHQAIPWSKRDSTDVWDVWFVFDSVTWAFEDDLKGRIQKTFRNDVEFAGSGAGPDGRDMEWLVDGPRVDEFLEVVEQTAQDYGVVVLDRKFQTGFDRDKGYEEPRKNFFASRRAEVLPSIEIGPTTQTDEIYDRVEEAMLNVARGVADGFRLGRYNLTLNGMFWVMKDFKTGEEVQWFKDLGPVHTKIVDFWLHDLW